LLNLEAIAKAPLVTEPVSAFMVPGVLSPVDLAAVRADFPQIADVGVFCVSELIFGPSFRELIAELQTPLFQSVIEDKLGVDLSDKTMTISVSGRSRPNTNGSRLDLMDHFVTCLLYLNDICDDRGGRLRLVWNENGRGMEISEIPLCGGTLASFLESDGDPHWYQPGGGELRCLKLRWSLIEAANNDAS